MDINQQFNTEQFNEGEGFDSSSLLTIAHETFKYFIEVRNKDGLILAVLDKWTNANYSEIKNEPSTLTFDYPGLDDKAQYLTFPNMIYLFDQKYTLIEKFYILPSIKSMSNGVYKSSVNCASLMWQLSKENLNYEVNDSSQKTVRTILEDWFYNQVDSYPLSIGFLDSNIADQEISISVENSNILEGLNKIYDQLQVGEFWVNPKYNQFNWKNKRNDYLAQEIRINKNLTGIKKDVAFNELFNRIYVYGDTDDDGKLKLTDISGYSEEYIQDDSSVSLYGVKSITKILDVNRNNISILEKYANGFLKEFAFPRTYYEIDCVDLFAAYPSKFSYMNLKMGSKVKIIDENLGIESIEEVTGIDRNLDSPINIKISLGKKTPNFKDTFGRILKRINELENRDTVSYSDDTSKVSEISKYDSSSNLLGASDFVSRVDHGHELPFDVVTFDNIDDRFHQEFLDTSSQIFNDVSGLIDEMSSNVDTTSILTQAASDASSLIDDRIAIGIPSKVTSNDSSTGDMSSRFALEDHVHNGMPWNSFYWADTSGFDDWKTQANDGEIVYRIGDSTTTQSQSYLLVDSEVKEIVACDYDGQTSGTFPPIPLNGMEMYTDTAGQIWVATHRDTRWSCINRLTTQDGLPPS